MIDVVYYLAPTGEITGTASFEDDSIEADWIADMDDDESYLLGEASADTDYILAGVITTRPTIVDDEDINVAADGTITVDIALPTGTTVTYEGTSTTSIAGEHFQFKSVVPGVYEFGMTADFPYVETVLVITCDAV